MFRKLFAVIAAAVVANGSITDKMNKIEEIINQISHKTGFNFTMPTVGNRRDKIQQMASSLKTVMQQMHRKFDL